MPKRVASAGPKKTPDATKKKRGATASRPARISLAISYSDGVRSTAKMTNASTSMQIAARLLLEMMESTPKLTDIHIRFKVHEGSAEQINLCDATLDQIKSAHHIVLIPTQGRTDVTTCRHCKVIRTSHAFEGIQ